MKFLEIFAWYGTGITLLAYFLNSFQIIASNSIVFQLMNLTGSIGLAILAYKKKTYQSSIVSIIWAIIATLSIFRIFS